MCCVQELSQMCASLVIPFKNEMAMELLEKGRVRFWTQLEKFTSACEVEYVFNDVIITQGKVGLIFIFFSFSNVLLLSCVSTYNI